MRLVFISALLCCASISYAQPAARLGLPNTSAPSPAPIIRAASDSLRDGPEPAAKLGQIGVGPSEPNDDPYNWGVPKRRVRDDVRPRDDRSAYEREEELPFERERRERLRERELERRRRDDDVEPPIRTAGGARLREPVSGRTTGFGGKGGGGDRWGEEVGGWIDDRRRDVREGLNDFTRRERDRLAFESDCEFDGFISPTTNPFLAEDPRALTELRAIFMYQTIPDPQYLYRGGNALFFGLQGRLALTERFSIVLHKLGGVSINPGADSALGSNTSLTEIHIGPKFAFWRVPDTQTIASFGLIFQLPIGGASVYQDTGNLSLVPYLSYGTRLGRTMFGTFNFMNVAGYSLGTNSLRSNYLYDTLHLDLDVANQHWLYPFVEMSWFYYTSNGTERPGLAFEARDLANVGAPVSGRNYLSIAPGVRFKLSETLQFGVATEFPLLGTKDLMQFRLGVDITWRY